MQKLLTLPRAESGEGDYSGPATVAPGVKGREEVQEEARKEREGGEAASGNTGSGQ